MTTQRKRPVEHRGMAYGITQESSPMTSPTLQCVNLTTVARPTCQSQIKANNMSNPDATDGMICATAPGKDTCSGDSGGPLVAVKNAVLVLIGITSWGIGCARLDLPGDYTNVAKYLDWIIATMVV